MRAGTAMLVTLSLLSLGGCKGFLGDEKAEARARELLDTIAKGQADKIYDGMVTRGFKTACSRKRNAALVKLFAEKLGPVKSMTSTGAMYYSGTGGSTATLNYSVTWQKGNGVLALRLKKSVGDWKVHMYNIQSDALLGIDEE